MVMKKAKTDYCVQIEGPEVDENGIPVLNVMGPTETGGIISFWIEDRYGEATVNIDLEGAERLKNILLKTLRENSLALCKPMKMRLKELGYTKQ